MLNLYVPDVQVCGEANSVDSGYELIIKETPDLIFLDVEMGDGTGFDLLSKFPDILFKIIFITGHNEYAVRAFKFSAIDYLLKPLDPDDLIGAVKRTRESLDVEQYGVQLEAFRQNSQNHEQAPEKIILRDAESIHLVSVSDIVRCQSEDNYTRFVIRDQPAILVSKTLKEYDKLFEGNRFFRAHQSHLINLNHFARYDKKEGGMVVMKDGSTLPVAIRKKEALFEALERLV